MCSRCHAQVGTDWRFCRYCGAPLEPLSQERPAPAPEESTETQVLSPSGAPSAPPTTPVYLPPEKPPSGQRLDVPPERTRSRFSRLVIVAMIALGATTVLGTLTQVGRYVWRELAPRRIVFQDTSSSQGAVFSQRLALPAGSEVTLTNDNGSVTITTWDEEAALITARKRGRMSRDLQDVRIEIAPAGRALAIRTIRPEDSDLSAVRVDYEIRLPRRVTLSDVRVINGHIRIRDVEGVVKVKTINGQIDLEGVTGAAEAEAVNGNIEVTLAQCARERNTTLQSVNGRIFLRLPQTCDASLRAETFHGEILTEGLSLASEEERLVGKSVEGQLGRGGPTIQLRTMNGTIRVRRETSP